MNWWLSPSNYCIQTMIPIYFFRQYIPFINDYNPIIVLVGGFNPSEKYEFVSWDDEISNWMEQQSIHVPNHQPAINIPLPEG
jgi:hypothetical protein